MKKLLLALALILLPTSSWAQCNGIFTNNTVCGNATGSSNLPRPTSPAAFLGAAGGSDQQIQYNNAGALGGLTDTQVTARINLFTSVLKGMVPASGGGTTNYLRADGVFAQPPGFGWIAASGASVAGDIVTYTNTTANEGASPGYSPLQIPGLVPTTSTVTISNGSPAVVTWAGHALRFGSPIFFCNSGGALNTGLTACVPATCAQCSPNTYRRNPTLYYVVPIDANTFNISSTLANARAGTFVNTSSAGSGTQTAFANAMACTGCIGEFIYENYAIANGTAATSGTEATWGSITLSAGIWEVGGEYGIFGDSGTPTFTDWHASVGYSVSGGFLTITSPFGGINAAHLSTNQSNGIVFPFGTQQIFLTGSQAISSAAKVNWTGGGTAVHYGGLWARRVK